MNHEIEAKIEFLQSPLGMSLGKEGRYTRLGMSTPPSMLWQYAAVLARQQTTRESEEKASRRCSKQGQEEQEEERDKELQQENQTPPIPTVQQTYLSSTNDIVLQFTR